MSPLRVTLTDTRAEDCAASEPGLLAAVRFGTETGPAEDPRVVTTPLVRLWGPATECWQAEGDVDAGTCGDIRYARTADLLMAHVHIAEPADDMRRLAAEGYGQLLEWQRQQPQRHLWRFWNVISGINEGDGDRERYREFSIGRHEVLTAFGLENALAPAATAIGGEPPGLFLMMLAGRRPAQAVENPRQTSAWEYPRQYGPRSPSFARAGRLPAIPGQTATVLVSGTASVVGHETRHVDDWQGQLRETLANLEALRAASAAGSTPQALRLYLREGLPDDDVIAATRAAVGESVPLIALRGDICRRELLLEIEAVW